ncbi:hypothetical protein L6164_032307 [Bauhinia variegata]|uniref:Uncharacterized protein n=1 Tax=Bauhinia variegata TaxID=167791 RepID=A0ACB9KN92_BAUVA|nr:hypothetical protein L6164_032307 [Bauhinia variegata]
MEPEKEESIEAEGTSLHGNSSQFFPANGSSNQTYHQLGFEPDYSYRIRVHNPLLLPTPLYPTSVRADFNLNNGVQDLLGCEELDHVVKNQYGNYVIQSALRETKMSCCIWDWEVLILGIILMSTDPSANLKKIETCRDKIGDLGLANYCGGESQGTYYVWDFKFMAPELTYYVRNVLEIPNGERDNVTKIYNMVTCGKSIAKESEVEDFHCAVP